MSIFEIENNKNLVISCVRALWGEITPELRAVSVEFSNNHIVWQCIFDMNATVDDFELVSAASTEVIADFNKYRLKENLIKIPFPNKMNHLKNLIYLRHENNYYKEKHHG